MTARIFSSQKTRAVSVESRVEHLVGKGFAEQHPAELPTLFVGFPTFLIGHFKRRQ